MEKTIESFLDIVLGIFATPLLMANVVVGATLVLYGASIIAKKEKATRTRTNIALGCIVIGVGAICSGYIQLM